VGYDAKTNTITVGVGSDFMADSAAFFVRVLRDLALEPGAASSIVKDWKTVAAWLERGDEELVATDYQKISAAWRSYVAQGIAPSVALGPFFKSQSKRAREERWGRTRVPPEICGVFDRLLASDSEIMEKRARDAVSFGESLQGMAAVERKRIRAADTTSRLRKFLQSLSRRQRTAMVLVVAWSIYVVYRTSGDHRLVGRSLDRWDGDSFLANLALPPLCIAVASWMYKWIRGGK
jgi:hypothetical protein